MPVMVQKKSFRNPVPIFFSWIKSHKLVTLLLFIAIFGVGVFSHNKYLDWQNVKDMKALLSAFEQLEKDVEENTGEDLAIEADCGSVGKFATSYSCDIFLKKLNNDKFDYDKFIPKNSVLNKANNRCSTITSPDAAYLNFFSCITQVRNFNTKTAESIFYKYDTSPGRAF
jgi:hypothetical protein